MKKTLLALILTIVSFSTVFVSQTLSLASANFIGWPHKTEYPWGHPEVTIVSPQGTYSQDNVWLNLTVTKPSNWSDFEGQLRYVTYLLDGNREDLIGEPGARRAETRIAVEDPLGVLNPPLEFNFYLKLTGLSEGMHHIEVYAEGFVKDWTVRASDSSFFVVRVDSSLSSTSSSTQDIGLNLSWPQQTAVFTGIVAVLSIVLLAIYFKKRQRDKS